MNGLPDWLLDGVRTIERHFDMHVRRVHPEAFESTRVGDGTGEAINTPVFSLQPTCRCSGSEHPEGCPPGFIHHRTGLRIDWPREAFGGSVSRAIQQAEWMAIEDEATASIDRLPRGYRVMVTGSRDWAPEVFTGYRLRANFRQIPSAGLTTMIAALRELRARAGDRHITIVHGAARGADMLAAALADLAHNAHSEAWPANWYPGEAGRHRYVLAEARAADAHPNRDRAMFKGAGYLRNAAMIDSGVDEVLAFFAAGAANRGTTHAANSARDCGLSVREYTA